MTLFTGPIARSGFLSASPPAYRWVHVRRRFERFLQNLTITIEQAEDGETKHKSVVRALNWAYWQPERYGEPPAGWVVG
jgi:hypothetical protein